MRIDDHPKPRSFAREVWNTFRESPFEGIVNVALLIAVLMGIVGAFAVIGACMDAWPK